MKSRLRFPTSLIAFASTLALAGVAWAQTGRYAVQIEASPARAEAEARVEQLDAQGVDAYLVESLVPGKGHFFRVRVGDFATRAAAEHYGRQLKAQGTVRDFFVAAYEAPEPDAPPNPAQADSTLPPTPPEPPALPAPIPSSQPDATDSTAGDRPDTPPTTSPLGSDLPAPASYALYQDADVGYSFEYPRGWVGRQLGPNEMAAQKVTAGAMFKSDRDAAFLSAIWNKLDRANSSDHDNDLVVDLILESLASGNGTKNLKALSRRVIQDGPQIKTFLDLEAAFQVTSRPAPLEFVGKGVIIRASRGVLLLVAFHAKDAPQTVAIDADHIVQSARTPD